TGEQMDDQQLRDEVMTLFAAGHETTSMSVSWTLHALLERPDIVARLREELSRVDVMHATYLDAVVKESMRLYPPIWMVARFVESLALAVAAHAPLVAALDGLGAAHELPRDTVAVAIVVAEPPPSVPHGNADGLRRVGAAARPRTSARVAASGSVRAFAAAP